MNSHPNCVGFICSLLSLGYNYISKNEIVYVKYNMWCLKEQKITLALCIAHNILHAIQINEIILSPVAANAQPYMMYTKEEEEEENG